PARACLRSSGEHENVTGWWPNPNPGATSMPGLRPPQANVRPKRTSRVSWYTDPGWRQIAGFAPCLLLHLGCTKPNLMGEDVMPVSAKVAGRIAAQMKRYQGVLATIQKKDISEADTVTVINDILADVCGYDKYHEVTSQYAIRGTFVDLAVKVDDNIRF